MTESDKAQVKMPGTPKPWMNATMRALLRTPGLRGWLGKSFAVITVTGSKTGNQFSTPVQYMKLDGHYVVLSQTARKWWRNIRTRPHVELLVAGTVVPAQATIVKSHAATELLAACLAGNPRVAKFYGLRPNSAGEFDAAHVEPLLERVVVIDISPDT